MKATFTGDWNIWWGLVAGLTLAYASWFLYRREVRSRGGWVSWTLPLLRAIAIFLIVLMLTGPVLRHRKTVGELSRIILLADASQSMEVTDDQMNASRKLLIAQNLGWLPAHTLEKQLLQAADALVEAQNRMASAAEAKEGTQANLREVTKAVLENIETALKELKALPDSVVQGRPEMSASKLSQRLSQELLAPARELSGKDLEPTKALAEMGRLRTMTSRWEQELRAAFSEYGRGLANSKDPAIVSALQKFDGKSRWQRLESLLLPGPDQLLGKIAAKHDPDLLALVEKKNQRLWWPDFGKIPKGFSIEPTGKATDLDSGLIDSITGRKEEHMAVILFSDGQHNDGNSPIQTAKILGNRKIPIFTVAMGGEAPPDLAVVQVKSPDAVFVEDRVKGEIVLKDDMPAGKPFTLKVEYGGQTVWEKKLMTYRTHLRKIPYDFSIKELIQKETQKKTDGVEILSMPLFMKVTASVIEGEKKKDNNEGILQTRAILQRQKILVLDGGPRWEFRYIHNLFERDAQWEVNALLSLKSTGRPELKRGDGPEMLPASRDSLFAYDLIVFGDLPRESLRPEELQWFNDFVGNRGGGLIFIDGKHGALAQYKGTPLETLLPVDWKTTLSASLPSNLELTDRGGSAPPLELIPNSKENADLWKMLPPPHWVASVAAQPGAECLMEAVVAEQKVPALVLRRFGAGKVMYSGFDESWRWRYEVADRYHSRYWNQLARWMMEPPFAVRDTFVSLNVGSIAYQPGESAEIRVRLRDENGRPLAHGDPKAVLFRDGKRVSGVSLVADDNESGIYRGKSSALSEGRYEVGVEFTGKGGQDMKARTEFAVRPPDSKEMLDLSCNEELLRQVAQTSGGSFLREEDAGRLIALLEPFSKGTVVESELLLWQSWWWFVPLILLFTAEWIIRKREGLL